MSSQPANFACRMVAAISLAAVGGCVSGYRPADAPLPQEPAHGNTARPDHGEVVRQTTAGEQAAVVAVRQIGIPYRYGGNTPTGFDCSGLVHFAYARAGKSVPRTTATQWKAFRPVPSDRLRTGDVLFFRIAGKMSHVGLYLGDGRFVHAPSSGNEVRVEALDTPFYRKAFIRAGRP